tara:strand:- start:404 stop:1912 length:1509 start_codon:yes stop_codon:yes gene_type:complete
MAITNATRLADFGSGIGTAGAVLQVDNTNQRIGIGTTIPNQMLQVGTAVSVYGDSGIVSATSFYGDASNLTGVANTDFINATQLNVIGVTTSGSFSGDVTGNINGTTGDFSGDVWVGSALTISGITTVYNTTESTSATTGALVISGGVGIAKSLNVTGNVTVGGTLTYEDVTNVDVLGLATYRSGAVIGSPTAIGATLGTGDAGSAIFAGIVTAGTCFKAGSVSGGAFGAGVGVTITGDGNIDAAGIVTASSFSGATNEWVLGADGTSHYTFTGPGLTGAENDPSIYVTRGEKYNFKNSSGGHPFRIQSTPNGSSGTQYNDGITNNDAADGTTLIWDVQFDSPSLLYYQCTAHANMGGKIYVGNSGSGTLLEGTLVEGMTSTTTAYSSSSDLNISNSNFHFSSANLAGTNNTLNIMSTTGINTDMADNQVMNITAVTACNASTAYVNRVSIDGLLTGITTHWVGGSAPSDGGGSGVDTYSFNVMKTGSATYIVIANQVKTSS